MSDRASKHSGAPAERHQSHQPHLASATPTDDIAAIAVALAGEPNASLSHGQELRFRSRGSLAVDVRKGQFYDFEAGVGGGPLQLVIHLGAAGTLEAARAWLDMQSLSGRSSSSVEVSAHRKWTSGSEQARSLFKRSLPIIGTPAELYLRSRQIDPLRAKALRYVESAFNVEVGCDLPAMLSPVTKLNHVGDLIGVQRTWLTAGGAKVALAAPRKMLGPLKGGGVVLSRLERTVLVGEGVETTLSASALFGAPGVASLGTANMVRLEMPSAVEVVLIAFDRDASGAGLVAAEALARKLRREGRRVELVEPPVGHKDFNSAAQAQAQALKGGEPSTS